VSNSPGVGVGVEVDVGVESGCGVRWGDGATRVGGGVSKRGAAVGVGVSGAGVMSGVGAGRGAGMGVRGRTRRLDGRRGSRSGGTTAAASLTSTADSVGLRAAPGPCWAVDFAAGAPPAARVASPNASPSATATRTSAARTVSRLGMSLGPCTAVLVPSGLATTSVGGTGHGAAPPVAARLATVAAAAACDSVRRRPASALATARPASS